MANTFTIGKTYGVRSICDHECVFRFTVTARTAKSVILKDSSGKSHMRRVRLVGQTEACDPHGRYSMSPVLMATDQAELFGAVA